MPTSLVFPLLLSFAFAAAAVAQDLSPTAVPPVAATSAQMDCAKPTARHDHAAERGMPTPMAAAPCGPAKPKAKAKAKAIVGHDHAKFHKNQ